MIPTYLVTFTGIQIVDLQEVRTGGGGGGGGVNATVRDAQVHSGISLFVLGSVLGSV